MCVDREVHNVPRPGARWIATPGQGAGVELQPPWQRGIRRPHDHRGVMHRIAIGVGGPRLGKAESVTFYHRLIGRRIHKRRRHVVDRQREGRTGRRMIRRGHLDGVSTRGHGADVQTAGTPTQTARECGAIGQRSAIGQSVTCRVAEGVGGDDLQPLPARGRRRAAPDQGRCKLTSPAPFIGGK